MRKWAQRASFRYIAQSAKMKSKIQKLTFILSTNRLWDVWFFSSHIYAYRSQFIVYRRVKQRRFDVDQDGTQFVKFGFVWISLIFVLCKYSVCVLLYLHFWRWVVQVKRKMCMCKESKQGEKERERECWSCTFLHIYSRTKFLVLLVLHVAFVLF